MKDYRILKRFSDDGELVSVGDTRAFSDARARDLLKNGLIEAAAEAEPTKKAAAKK